jgi:hypothetical protein
MRPRSVRPFHFVPFMFSLGVVLFSRSGALSLTTDELGYFKKLGASIIARTIFFFYNHCCTVVYYHDACKNNAIPSLGANFSGIFPVLTRLLHYLTLNVRQTILYDSLVLSLSIMFSYYYICHTS